MVKVIGFDFGKPDTAMLVNKKTDGTVEVVKIFNLESLKTSKKKVFIFR